MQIHITLFEGVIRFIMGEAINVKRVIKNTLALYFRMFFLVLISLYTVRIVLDILGVNDYGIYNVISGFVGLLSFITGTLSVAAQRYFASNLVNNDWEKINKLFFVNMVIAVFISIIAIFMTETIGIWFISNQMVIPLERMSSAIIVFRLSIIIFIVSLLVYPFIALLVADENLSIYSLVSIFEGIFKLLIVYALCTINYDKLVVYATMLTIVSILVNAFYVIYVIKKYKGFNIIICREKDNYKEMLFFMNWNLIGALAVLLKGQGINIIMNLFFGPAVNAAKGISFQISNVILLFAHNFMRAISPQIIKSYAIGDHSGLLNIIDSASKFSYFLLFFVAMPFIFNIEYLLSIWLINIPEYTIIFVILTLVDVLITEITDVVENTILATGKIRNFQLSTGLANLILNLPLVYIILKIDANPIYPLVICIIVSIFVSILRVINLKLVYNFSISRFFRNVLFPIMIISLLVYFIDEIFFSNANNFFDLIYNTLGSTIITIIFIYIIGLNKREKIFLKNFILKKLRKKNIRI